MLFNNGNFLSLRPYHGEHGPVVPVTPEDIVLQLVLQKRECVSILTNDNRVSSMYSIPRSLPLCCRTTLPCCPTAPSNTGPPACCLISCNDLVLDALRLARINSSLDDDGLRNATFRTQFLKFLQLLDFGTQLCSVVTLEVSDGLP
jgi:hypothetical protein